MAITYHAAAHFVCFHCLDSDKYWVFYDGMKEMYNPGSGQTVCTTEAMERDLTSSHTVGHIVLVRLDEAPSDATEVIKKCVNIRVKKC